MNKSPEKAIENVAENVIKKMLNRGHKKDIEDIIGQIGLYLATMKKLKVESLSFEITVEADDYGNLIFKELITTALHC